MFVSIAPLSLATPLSSNSRLSVSASPTRPSIRLPEASAAEMLECEEKTHDVRLTGPLQRVLPEIGGLRIGDHVRCGDPEVLLEMGEIAEQNERGREPGVEPFVQIRSDGIGVLQPAASGIEGKRRARRRRSRQCAATSRILGRRRQCRRVDRYSPCATRAEPRRAILVRPCASGGTLRPTRVRTIGYRDCPRY